MREQRTGSAVWGGATAGLVIGLIVGLIIGSVGSGIVWGVAVGALLGVVAEVMGAVSDYFRYRGPTWVAPAVLVLVPLAMLIGAVIGLIALL